MTLRAALSRVFSLFPGKGRPLPPPGPESGDHEQKMRRAGRDYEDKRLRVEHDK